MPDSFQKLKKRRSQLPDPPTDATQNLQAPETAPLNAELQAHRPTIDRLRTAVSELAPPRPRIDGRTRLRKDRTEALSTKIKPHHRELLMSLADAYEATLSETLERAIEALEAQARQQGRV